MIGFRSTNDRACVNSFGLDALLTNHLKFGNRQFVMLADKGFTTGIIVTLWI